MARARTAKPSEDEPSQSAGAGAGPEAATGSIDEILGGLERVVEELESGELPLERALERFEQGVKLAREGSKVLDSVEERVEILLADRDGAVPFAQEEDQ